MAKKKTKAKKKTSKKKPVRKGMERAEARKRGKKKTGGRTKVRRDRAKPQAAAQTPTPPKPKPGAFIWHELMTTDTARCRSFYSELFKWKTEAMEMMPGFNYTMFKHAGQPHAGMMAITPEHGDVRPHWEVYVKVTDVDAAAAKCEQLGGEVIVPPHDIPVGRWAMLKDPTGAAFCVYKGKS